jgi:imidazolonepropionase-like amidohydrolase
VITRRIFALALGLALALFTRAPLGQTRNVKALVGGMLIDGNASHPIQNSVIIIDGERVRAVGQVGTLAVPVGAEVISTEGMTVLPGLWDMHVHLQLVGHSDYDHWDKTYPPAYESIIFPAAAKQLLLAGVTSARDLGGPLAPSISARDRINAGKDSRTDDVRLGAVHSARAVPGHRGVSLGRQRPRRCTGQSAKAGRRQG